MSVDMTIARLKPSFLFLDSEALLLDPDAHFDDTDNVSYGLRQFKDYQTFGILCENGQYYAFDLFLEKPRTDVVLIAND